MVAYSEHPSGPGEPGMPGAAVDWMLIEGGVCSLVILITAIAISACCVHNKRWKQKSRRSHEAELGRVPMLTHSRLSRRRTSTYQVTGTEDEALKVRVPTSCRRMSAYSRSPTLCLQPPSHKLPADLLQAAKVEATIDQQDLKLGEVIATGTFSLVYKGRLRKNSHKMNRYQQVTVKTVHGEGCSPSILQQFIEDGLPFRHFDNPHVLSLIGLIIRNEQPYLLVPRTDKGVLYHYITDYKKHLTVKSLLEMGLGVAEGLVYLSKEGFVHRDIATRNCLVGNDDQVLIGDNALSQDLFPEDYFVLKQFGANPLPVGWMAVETLTDLTYSPQSDLWSLGVVLWELLTRGQAPYGNMTGNDVIKFVSGGHRLVVPSTAPPRLLSLMMSCWKEDPDGRPYVSDVCDKLESILQCR